MLELRSKLAKLLGFKNYSEYCLITLCAKTPENVDEFLNKLKEKMRILQKKEMDLLLQYKKKEVKYYSYISKFRQFQQILYF